MSPGAPTDYTNRLLISGSTHFTGSNSHITASGNISASGDIKAANFGVPTSGKLYLDIEQSSPNDYIVLQSGQIEIFKGGSQKLSIQSSAIRLQDNTDITGHVTASGTISASGELIAASGSFEIIHGGTFKN